nr:unnamed protein product [Callosobruchus analis]
MNYAVANSEGVFIREETLEDDESPIEDYGYEDEYYKTARITKRKPQQENYYNNTSNNENEDIDDIFYPRDILSKITGHMDEVDKDGLTKRCSKLDDKEWRKMILDVAELIYCNEAILEFELHSFRTQLMPQTYLKKNLLQKGEINDNLIIEFRRFALETVVNIILFGVANDVDKPDGKFHPLLIVTKTQWLFLKLMFRLEEEKMSGILQLYLQKAENLLYSFQPMQKIVRRLQKTFTRCGSFLYTLRLLKLQVPFTIIIKRNNGIVSLGLTDNKVEPVTRLYVAICKLKGDVNRVRRFCCEAFYYTEDLAVPLMFTVLTSWVEIFPMQDDMKCYPIADVMVQLIHLKTIKKPQYKLHALKWLLNQYYGYAKDRVNCDEFLKDLTQKYLSEEANWLKEKINDILKPMVYQVPVGDNKFKATVITLLANVCQHLHLGSRDKFMVELKEWFSSLSGGNSPKVIKQSVQYALNMLQKKQTKCEIRAKRRTDPILRER